MVRFTRNLNYAIQTHPGLRVRDHSATPLKRDFKFTWNLTYGIVVLGHARLTETKHLLAMGAEVDHAGSYPDRESFRPGVDFVKLPTAMWAERNNIFAFYKLHRWLIHCITPWVWFEVRQIIYQDTTHTGRYSIANQDSVELSSE